MRILLVSDSYPPLVGGATRAVQQLAHLLDARGHVVVVATSWQAGAPARERDGAIVVHRLRDLTLALSRLSADDTRHTPPPWPDPALVKGLNEIVHEHRPDVVYAYGWLTYACVWALRRTTVPLVVSTHDYGNVCAKRTLLYSDGKPCAGPSLRKCLPCAGEFYGAAKGSLAVAGVLGGLPSLRRRTIGVAYNSSYTRSRVMAAAGGQLGHIGLAEVIAPPLQPVAGEDPADEHVLATLPASYILFVGALRIVKGVETLLRAYATLVDPPPLILMGSRTPDTPDLSVNGVRVVEGANNATVLRAWDRALFGVSPSVLPEPLGLVVLEAMRHGRAVIGSRPGGHEELIEHGHTGLLVAGGDTEGLAAAMQALTDDSALRQRMGERARTKAAEYDPQVLVARIETLLQGAIARAKALPGPPPQRDQR